MLSLHTSPLAQPGSGAVAHECACELVSALAGGVTCDLYRRTSPDQADVVQVEPGHRVVHVPAGPYDLARATASVLQEFGDVVMGHIRTYCHSYFSAGWWRTA